MKNHTIPGLVILVMAFALLSACSSAKLPALQQGDVVVAFGDSLTEGYGVKPNESYPTVLAELSGFEVINAGVSGETTAQGIERLPEVMEQHKPKLVILLEGGNDVLRKVPEAQIEANLRTMISRIQKSGAAVILVGVPEKKLFGSSLDLYSDIAGDLAIPLEDDIVASLMRRPSMKSDYIHFNNKGYGELAQAIYEVMQDYGAI